jgi:hypothetical protein
MRRFSEKAYGNKVKFLRGEYLETYSLLDWGMNLVICEHLTPKGHNPLMYLVNRIANDVKIKLYLEIVHTCKYLSKEEVKALSKWMEHLTKIRNFYAHSLVIYPELSDYRECQTFKFNSLGTLFKGESILVDYSFQEQEEDLKKMETIINFNQIFIDVIIEDIITEETGQLTS